MSSKDRRDTGRIGCAEERGLRSERPWKDFSAFFSFDLVQKWSSKVVLEVFLAVFRSFVPWNESTLGLGPAGPSPAPQETLEIS